MEYCLQYDMDRFGTHAECFSELYIVDITISETDCFAFEVTMAIWFMHVSGILRPIAKK